MRRFVIAETARAAADALSEANRACVRLVAGWDLPAEPWNLARHGYVCTGTVSTPEDLERAVAAAARGVDLVIQGPVAPELLPGLVEDLRRIGTVEFTTAAPALQHEQLNPDDAALLRLLAEGQSLADAARALHISRRTATRRLARARLALGVATNREAVVMAARGRQDSAAMSI